MSAPSVQTNIVPPSVRGGFSADGRRPGRLIGRSSRVHPAAAEPSDAISPPARVVRSRPAALAPAPAPPLESHDAGSVQRAASLGASQPPAAEPPPPARAAPSFPTPATLSDAASAQATAARARRRPAPKLPPVTPATSDEGPRLAGQQVDRPGAVFAPPPCAGMFGRSGATGSVTQ